MDVFKTKVCVSILSISGDKQRRPWWPPDFKLWCLSTLIMRELLVQKTFIRHQTSLIWRHFHWRVPWWHQERLLIPHMKTPVMILHSILTTVTSKLGQGELLPTHTCCQFCCSSPVLFRFIVSTSQFIRHFDCFDLKTRSRWPIFLSIYDFSKMQHSCLFDGPNFVLSWVTAQTI